jgi:isopentenyl phosphate kinase
VYLFGEAKNKYRRGIKMDENKTSATVLDEETLDGITGGVVRKVKRISRFNNKAEPAVTTFVKEEDLEEISGGN